MVKGDVILSKRKYISDIITEKEIDSWSKGELVSIKAPTGSGKSYFIMSTLYQKAVKEHKKILMLLHRKNCIKQFKKELGWKLDNGVIDITSYQALESRIRRGDILSLSKYDYLCLDEWHYAMYDSGFNFYTDLSLNIILKQENAVRLFISATSENMIKYVKNEGFNIKEYVVDNDFSHITDITFFQNDDFYSKFIRDRIKNGDKGIIFINDTEKAFKLHISYPSDTLFVCSESNNYYTFVKENKVDELLENERFEESVLITTIALDTGVNIYDKDIKHIAVALSEEDVIIQCLGRKRLIDEEDTFSLYMKEYTNQYLNGFKRKEVLKLEKAGYYLTSGEKKFIEKYGRELGDVSSSLLYEVFKENGVDRKIHKLMYASSNNRIDELNNYMNKGFKDYYTNEVFGLERYKSISEDDKYNELKSYLNSILNKPLTEFEKEELIERIDYKIDGKVLRSRRMLNNILDSLGLGFSIQGDKDNRRVLENGEKNPFRGRVYWKVIRSIGD